MVNNLKYILFTIAKSVSLIENEASLVQYLISQAVIKSTAPPMQWPCMAAITGTLQFSGSEIALWRYSMMFESASLWCASHFSFELITYLKINYF